MQLFCKELKEKKITFILGIIISLFCPLVILLAGGFISFDSQLFKEFSYIVSWIGFFVMLVFLPALLTAPNFSGEVEKKTLSFALHLPVSREKIWATKLLSSLFLSFSLIAFYIFVNFTFLKLNLILADDIYLFYLIIVSLPLLIAAITSLTSVFFDNELSSVIFSLIFLAVTILGLFALAYGMEWSMSWRDIFIYSLCSIVFYLSLSYFVFLKSELLGSLAQKSKTLVFYLIPVLILVSIPVYALFNIKYNFNEYNSGYIYASALNHNKTELFVGLVYSSPDEYYELVKIWCLSLKDNKVMRKFKERHIYDMVPSPAEDKVILSKYKKLSLGSFMICREKPAGIWLKDLRKNKNKLLLSDRDVGDRNNCILWSADGEKIICVAQKMNSECSDVYIFDKNGKIIKNFIVPYGRSGSYHFRSQLVNDNLYIYFPGQSDKVLYQNGIYRISLKDYKVATAYSYAVKQSTEEMKFSPVSPDEKYLVYTKINRQKKGEYSFGDLALYNLNTHEEEILERDICVDRIRFEWVDENMLAFSYFIGKAKNEFNYNLKILNINNPQDFIIIDRIAGPWFYISPDGKKILYNDVNKKRRLFTFEILDLTSRKSFEFYGGSEFLWDVEWYNSSVFYFSRGCNIMKVDIDKKCIESIFPRQFKL